MESYRVRDRRRPEGLRKWKIPSRRDVFEGPRSLWHISPISFACSLALGIRTSHDSNVLKRRIVAKMEPFRRWIERRERFVD